MRDDTTRHGRTEQQTDTGATRRDFLKAASAGAVATGLGLGAGAVGTASASSGINTPWLHVEGNTVKDPLGNEVILRGVNVPDPKRLNVTAPARGKNAEQLIDMATSADDGWYSRVVRLPVHPGDIAELPPVPEADVDVHVPPTFTREELETYIEDHLDPAVEQCWDRGVYCIIDYHRHWGEGELEWNYGPLDEEVRMFWDVVASHYDDHPHVIFEVYNEPTLPGMYGEWGTADLENTWREWKDTAQPWVDQIREHAPDNLIIIGSPGWSSSPEGAMIEEFDGENLMYAYHIYSGHGLRSEEDFDGREEAEATNGVWEHVPVFCTEFGWETLRQGEAPGSAIEWLDGQTDDFGEAIYNWMDNRPIHWTVWCFDITWLPSMFERGFTDEDPVDAMGDPYSAEGVPEDCPDLPCEWDLLGEDVGAYDDYMGAFMKEWLYDRRNDDLPQVDYDPYPPEVPEDLTVIDADERSVDISWSPVDSPGDSPFSHYNVYVDGEKHTEVTDTEVTVDDLLSDTTFEIGVSGEDGTGNVSEPATIEATTEPIDDDTPPTIPGGLTLESRTYHSLTIEWEESAANGPADVFEYVVYVDGAEHERVPDGTTTTTLEDLDPSAQYEVAVTAFDRASNESDPNAIVLETRSNRATENDLLINDYGSDSPWPSSNMLDEWVGGDYEGVSDGVLRLEYDDIWWYATGVNRDITDHAELRLLVRGDEGGEEREIDIRFADLDQSLASLSEDTIGTEFDVFIIDLEAADADLTDPGQIQFQTDIGTSGAIEIDEIWLAAEDDPADGIVDEDPDVGADVSPPHAFTVESTTESSVTVSWGVDVPDDADIYVDYYNVYLGGSHYAEVDEGEITIDGLDAGTTYTIGVSAVDQDGNTTTVSTIQATTDGGEEPAGLDVTGDGNAAQDLTGDGLYEDITGDGNFGFNDVVTFFEEHDGDVVQNNVEYFDFSDSGSVGFNDVVALFERL
ncbi:cellulase family glycosylhydrolase [Natronobiforma cellulositropha]|uniref:cellulase family glycosylhydrolase n=1 Tax=Natronobiforma cellulositropha TaxID=1679076 RepID=UPI0021D5DFF1|nr:cellulase family glycosylhydrolase [Natronobiforma cellulositropha]